MRRDRERLQDILEAIERLESRRPSERAAFEADELVQVWVVHHLQIIGEAASMLSQEFRSRASEVPWREITRMRNILVHHYFKVDLDIVWAVLERDLAPLKEKVGKRLAQLSAEG